MSKTQLQTNNAKLEALITELQGKAAGGGSGGSVETCTVTIKPLYGSILYGYTFTQYIDGAITTTAWTTYDGTTGNVTVENVMCGSAISLYTSAAAPTCNITGGAEVTGIGMYGTMYFNAPATGGGEAILSVYDNA